MALFMPLVCSETWRKIFPLRWLAAITAFSLLSLMPSKAGAESRWSQGVFPIVQFQGYTSHFGPRAGFSGAGELHTGLDIAAPLGSPVLSWWSGEVVEMINDRACGLGLVMASGDYAHIYCHLQQRFVALGQRVLGGQRLGSVGVTGRTSGPHLHWGIRYRGQWLNPDDILRAMVKHKKTARSFGP